MVQYTASHSLSELIGLCSLGEGYQEQQEEQQQQKKKQSSSKQKRWRKNKHGGSNNNNSTAITTNNNNTYNSKNVHLTCVSKRKILLDVRSGYYMNVQLTKTGQSCMSYSMITDGGITTPYEIDKGLLNVDPNTTLMKQQQYQPQKQDVTKRRSTKIPTSNLAKSNEQLAMWEYCQTRAITKAKAKAAATKLKATAAATEAKHTSGSTGSGSSDDSEAACPSLQTRATPTEEKDQEADEEEDFEVDKGSCQLEEQSCCDSMPTTEDDIEIKFHYIQLAIHYCNESIKLTTNSTTQNACQHQRRALIETAISTCPDLCCQSYYMKYELLSEALVLPQYYSQHPFQHSLDDRDNGYEGAFYQWKDYKMLNEKEHEILSKCLSCLRNGVHAGKAFLDLIHANDDDGDGGEADQANIILKGQLYTFLPTRWLIRSLYTLGCLEYYCGHYDEANMYFKQCLAMDVHDKLGARHKQLMVLMERACFHNNLKNLEGSSSKSSKKKDKKQNKNSGGSSTISTNKSKKNSPKNCTNGDEDEDLPAAKGQERWGVGFLGSKELKNILKAKFGEDQRKDTVLALWNYTRALHAYVSDGCCFSDSQQHHGNCSNKKKGGGDVVKAEDVSNCGSASFRKLLSYAMDKNPHVPPLLLNLEIPKEPYTFMKVGDESEAADYCHDNRIYWESTKGALAAMEAMYRSRFPNATKRAPSVKPKRSSPRSLRKVAATTSNMNDSNGSDNKEAAAVLSEGIALLYKRQYQDTSTYRRSNQDALSKLQQVFRMLDPHAAQNQQLLRKCFQGQAIAYSRLGEYEASFQYYSNALSVVDLSDVSTMQSLYCDRAACRERFGDLRGSLEEYKYVYARSGQSNCKAMEGMFRIESRLGVDSSSIPVPPVPKIDTNIKRTPSCCDSPSVASTMERCSNCERGGVKLMLCSGCGEDSSLKFCSKDCHMALWKKSHKYYCKGSKKRLEIGMTVVIQGLQSATEHNGKQGRVIRLLEDKGRFGIEIIDGNSTSDNDEEEKEEKNHNAIEGGTGRKSPSQIQLSVRPENLRKQE